MQNIDKGSSMAIRRKAVAMIELIFAIVVMGIAMLALPMITAQSSKGIESAIMQESVSEVASNMNIVLAKYWDEENTKAGQESMILSTTNGNFAARSGLIQDYNGRTTKDQTAASNDLTFSVADDPDGSDDLSDFNTQVINLDVYSNQENQVYEGDYIDKSISLATTVAFAPDNVAVAGNTLTYNFDPKAAAAAGSTDIKRVNITLTTANTAAVSQSGSLKDIEEIQLNGFSCNIGAAIPAANGS
jgi:hypothetical protein